jgi:hypothetical protein
MSKIMLNASIVAALIAMGSGLLFLLSGWEALRLITFVALPVAVLCGFATFVLTLTESDADAEQ